MRFPPYLALLAALLVACGRDAPARQDPLPPAAPACPACGAPASAGTLTNRQISEASGVVASALHPDAFYLHNDSGDTPRIFAVTRSGGDLGTFQITGASAVDWEDMARGPCPDGAMGASCLYIGDIGDNRERRDSYTIYVVPEPEKVGAGGDAPATLAARSYPFTYPDGSHNAEVLLVDPRDGAITLVTKVSSGASRIFELPTPLPRVDPGAAAPTVALTAAGQVTPHRGIPRLTGGDVHPRRKGVLLRTYTHLFFYPMEERQTVAQALAGEPCDAPAAGEPQGEAVGWLPSGAGYVTVSEQASAAVYVVSCAALGEKAGAP